MHFPTPISKPPSPYIRKYKPTINDTILDLLMKPYMKNATKHISRHAALPDKRFARRVHLYLQDESGFNTLYRTLSPAFQMASQHEEQQQQSNDEGMANDAIQVLIKMSKP